MKHLLFLISLILFSNGAYPTHILGGTINYKYISSTSKDITYSLSIDLYRDCFNGNPASFASDSIITIGIYDKVKKLLIATESFTIVGLKHYTGCLGGNDLCIDIGLYQKNIVLPKNDSGYLALYSRCCFTSLISNVYLPDKNGMSLLAFISPMSFKNSSPQFYFMPQFIAETGINNFDFGAIDYEGDSLVYSMANPYYGGSQADPTPLPANGSLPPKPIVFSTGYSYTNPLGSKGSITIDSKTGKIVFKNSMQGIYMLSTELKEFRNGQLIGTTYRTYPFFFITAPIGNTTTPLLNKPIILNNLKVSLSWVMCNINVSKYLLERRIGSGSWSLINSSTDNAPYIDTISRDIKYNYRVRAVVKTDTIYSNYETVFITNTKINSFLINQIKIYPNPFNDKINFQLIDNESPLTVNIYTITGILIKHETLKNIHLISTSEIPKGIYTLEITTKEGSIIRKSIVKLE